MNGQHTTNYGSKGTGAASESSKAPYKASRTSPEAGVQFAGIKDVQERKRSLTLDFSDSKSIRKTLDTQEVLQFLGLSSPDFERFLSQNVAVVSQTPTPTQFFYPKNVTAEQEQYARGFIDALNQIHQMRGFVPMSNLMSPGFVSNTVAQADKEDAKPLIGAIQEQFLAFATTSRSPVAADNSSTPTTCVSASASAKSSSSAPVSTSSSPAAATAAGRTPPRSKIDTSPSSSSTSFATASTSGVACPYQRTKLHCRRQLAKTSSRHFKASTVKSACCLDSKTSVSNSVPSSPRQTVKTELMEFPMPFEFDPNYMSSLQLTADGVPNAGDFFMPAGAVSAATLHTLSRTVSVPPNVVLRNPMQEPQRQQASSCFVVSQQEHVPVASGKVHPTTSVPSSCASASMGRSAALLEKAESECASVKSVVTLPCTTVLTSTAAGSCTVMAPGGFASGISPIDPDLQEQIKLERKRARNRIAATKCRRRKIEKINELEGRVREITEQKQAIMHRVRLLRVEVTRLREAVHKHRVSGCLFGGEAMGAKPVKQENVAANGP
uniref:BZIP domain-containing protein n=1 Tax=Trichuris muris TaxID=70415 RepID=A0A5S6QDT0_TRIMR